MYYTKNAINIIIIYCTRPFITDKITLNQISKTNFAIKKNINHDKVATHGLYYVNTYFT
jgi:hypothetical protein